MHNANMPADAPNKPKEASSQGRRPATSRGIPFIPTRPQVILFEPLYDSYLPMIRRAGAVPRIVQLRPPAWAFQLEGALCCSSLTARL